MFYFPLPRINVLCLFFAFNIATSLVQLKAQIVNIEDRRQTYDSVGWYGQLDLGGNYSKNSSKVLNLHSSLRLDRHGAAGEQLLFMADYRVIQANGSNFLNAGFAHLRYGHRLSNRLVWEAFTQLQYDEKIRLSLRWLIGSGPRWELAKGEGGRIHFGLLYMYEYDELSNRSFFFHDHRLSSYLSTQWKLAKNLVFSTTTYYQPRLPDFNQARLSSGTNLSYQITSRIGISTRIDATYDARIADVFPEVPSLTFIWRNGLRWRF